METRPPHGLKAFKIRNVCKKCNNEWMGSLEIWFKQTLGHLIEPGWPSRANEVLDKLLPQSRILARWALKTAVLFDQTTMMGEIIPASIADSVYRDSLPEYLNVDIGLIKDSAIRILHPRGFWTKIEGGTVKFCYHENGGAFQTLFQLHHLAIRVTLIPLARILYWRRRGHSLPLPCYPNSGDPRSSWYIFEKFDDFASNCVLDPTYLIV